MTFAEVSTLQILTSASISVTSPTNPSHPCIPALGAQAQFHSAITVPVVLRARAVGVTPSTFPVAREESSLPARPARGYRCLLLPGCKPTWQRA